VRLLRSLTSGPWSRALPLSTYTGYRAGLARAPAAAGPRRCRGAAGDDRQVPCGGASLRLRRQPPGTGQ